MGYWTKAEMEDILKQLEDRECLFSKYHFSRHGESLSLLGKGAFAYVYEVENEKGIPFAMKVIGFGDKRLDPSFFQELVQIQKYLGSYQSNVVRVYDFRELWVWLDEDGHVGRVADYQGGDLIEKADGQGKSAGGRMGSEEANRLCLQFILMEKLEPVIRKDAFVEPTLFPEKLAAFREGEIVKLALDIGGALQEAHKKKILHRDIKLENIFYSAREGRYKLGDFGIAKVTLDGMAETVTFTKGYGAPEVVDVRGKYDNTADIYSFGILLYVLLNHLRFPGSDGYYVQPGIQYSKGAVLPAPEIGKEALREIVLKMCAFDPAQRFQSLDEILYCIKELYGTAKANHQNRHGKAYTVVGLLCLVSGLMLGMPCFFAGQISGMGGEWRIEKQWHWIPVFLLSNGILLLWKNMEQKLGYLPGVRKGLDGDALTASEREERLMETVVRRFEKIPFMFYALLVMWGFCLNVLAYSSEGNPIGMWLRSGFLGKIGEIHIGWAGVTGILFWIFWTFRENMLIRLDR